MTGLNFRNDDEFLRGDGACKKAIKLFRMHSQCSNPGSTTPAATCSPPASSCLWGKEYWKLGSIDCSGTCIPLGSGDFTCDNSFVGNLIA